MAWQVATTTEITLQELQFNLNHYFTELMHPKHWAKEFTKPELVLKDLDITESGTQFKGQITFFDGFHTGKVMTVKILGNQTLCKTTGKSVILFRMSPKDFDESIWDELNAIVIHTDDCLD